MLHRAPDKSPPRDVWALVVLAPLERLTEALRRGDPFSTQSLADMQALQRRLGAFDAALSDRLVIEEERDRAGR